MLGLTRGSRKPTLFLGLATSNVRHADGMVVLRPHLVAGFVQLLQTAAELNIGSLVLILSISTNQINQGFLKETAIPIF